MFNLSQDKFFYEAAEREGNSFINCTRSLEKLLLFQIQVKLCIQFYIAASLADLKLRVSQ